SGHSFGGTAANMLSVAALDRFPADNPANFAEYRFTLSPGQMVKVEKSPGNYAYTVIDPAGERHRRTGKPEQVLLLETDLLTQN
ncbi:MAG: hypothetical protein D3924_13915, partial [Candidatus Electrothrix sp. AR4]|nr:hypothetical protein [Candidatus Electrothrix sp. AR4]